MSGAKRVVHHLHYEKLLLSNPGKENKYKIIFNGNSLSCMAQNLRPSQEYTVRLQVYLDANARFTDWRNNRLEGPAG